MGTVLRSFLGEPDFYWFDWLKTATDFESLVPRRKGMDFYRASNSPSWGAAVEGDVCRGCVQGVIYVYSTDTLFWVWLSSVTMQRQMYYFDVASHETPWKRDGRHVLYWSGGALGRSIIIYSCTPVSFYHYFAHRGGVEKSWTTGMLTLWDGPTLHYTQGMFTIQITGHIKTISISAMILYHCLTILLSDFGGRPTPKFLKMYFN
jgi:hypothetical protein